MGFSNTYNGDRSFIWEAASTMKDLGSLEGMESSRAYGVNENGEVVGWNFMSERSYRPILPP
jgi:uncharacterized membrane protein